MIAKGNLHAHGAKLAAYLTANFGDETAELVELRGFAATNIRDAFIDVQMQAAATKAAGTKAAPPEDEEGGHSGGASPPPSAAAPLARPPGAPLPPRCSAK